MKNKFIKEYLIKNPSARKEDFDSNPALFPHPYYQKGIFTKIQLIPSVI